jgi:FMN phosphatase YigB (HAD superfamily)
LSGYFDAVVVSSDLGVAKPDPAIFTHALSQLQLDASCAVMVGDSLERDVDGAIAAGLAAVWINRGGRLRPPGRAEVIELSSLSGLAGVLPTLAPSND